MSVTEIKVLQSVAKCRDANGWSKLAIKKQFAEDHNVIWNSRSTAVFNRIWNKAKDDWIIIKPSLLNTRKYVLSGNMVPIIAEAVEDLGGFSPTYTAQMRIDMRCKVYRVLCRKCNKRPNTQVPPHMRVMVRNVIPDPNGVYTDPNGVYNARTRPVNRKTRL